MLTIMALIGELGKPHKVARVETVLLMEVVIGVHVFGVLFASIEIVKVSDAESTRRDEDHNPEQKVADTIEVSSHRAKTENSPLFQMDPSDDVKSMVTNEDNGFPEPTKKAFQEFESSEPSSDPDASVPPRDVTARAEDFLSNVNWSAMGPPQIYTFDTSLDMVWNDLGVTVHPDGIDVYTDRSQGTLVINASVDEALRVARKQQKNLFKGGVMDSFGSKKDLPE